MMSQSVLFPMRIFALATIAMLLFVSEANAFRIFHVANSSAGKSSPIVRYIYPKNFKLDFPLEFSVRERNRKPVIINQVTSCYCPHVEVHVTLHRRGWYRHGQIKVHRAAVFRRPRIRLHKAGYFNY